MTLPSFTRALLSPAAHIARLLWRQCALLFIASEQTIFLHSPGEPGNSSFSNALLHQRQRLLAALVCYIYTFPKQS